MKYSLNKYLNARRPIIWCNSSDYKEIDSLLKESTTLILDKKIYEYRALGVIDFYTKDIKNEITFLYEFIDLIYLEGYKHATFLLIKNANLEIDKPEVLAYLKKIAELKYSDRSYNFTTIIVSDYNNVPVELEKYTTIYEIPKMTEVDISNYILKFAEINEINIKFNELEEISISLKGLTKLEIDHILNMMIEDKNYISLADKEIITKEKGEIIKKSSKLELIEKVEEIKNIGGINNLKNWLENKVKIFKNLEKAKEFGLNTPKGLIITGMPGCGKSLIAKATSSLLDVPLIKFHISIFMENNVSEAENSLRNALKMAEATSPCILWIDEIENFFNISGDFKLLFEELIIWLEEKDAPVFVIATINDLSQFPIDILKKEKFDEIFFIDFPNEKEREEIFKIHFEKRKIFCKNIDYEKLSKQTEGYSGKDIDKILEIVLEKSFLNKNITINEELILKEVDEKISSFIRFKDKILEIKEVMKNINYKLA